MTGRIQSHGPLYIVQTVDIIVGAPKCTHRISPPAFLFPNTTMSNNRPSPEVKTPVAARLAGFKAPLRGSPHLPYPDPGSCPAPVREAAIYARQFSLSTALFQLHSEPAGNSRRPASATPRQKMSRRPRKGQRPILDLGKSEPISDDANASSNPQCRAEGLNLGKHRSPSKRICHENTKNISCAVPILAHRANYCPAARIKPPPSWVSQRTTRPRRQTR